MFQKANEYIDYLVKEKELPLLNVMAYKNHERIYSRCGSFTGSHGENEILCMFSCTKVITAVCGMRLVEEGKIELDAPVWDYIPDFKRAYTLDGNGNKVSERITVRHLFTMSTGLDYKLTGPETVKLAREKYDTATTTDVISSLFEKPLHFKPGYKFLYSLSHDALGALIETVTGMSLADYAEENIFLPLGMKSSTLHSAKNILNPPTNYEILEGGGFIKEAGNSYKHFHPTKKYSSGGAGLVGTAEDYAIFADALAAGGTGENGYRLLKAETIEKMKGVQFDCLNVKNNYTCVQGKDYAYGLGVRVRTVKDSSGIPVGEFGWDGAAGSYTLIDTDNAISITMGMNVMNWPEIFRGEHLAIARLIYEEII